MVRHGFGSSPKRPEQLLGIVTYLSGEPPPMPRCYVPQAVLASDFHRESQTNGTHSRIGQRAGEIVKRSEPGSRLGAQKESVIFRMGVGPRDEPIEGDGSNEGVCVLSGRRGKRSQEFGDFADPRAAVALILFGGRKTQGLANVFLMNSADRAARSDAVIPFDDDCDLVFKAPNL